MDDTKIERVARSICTSMGLDPDEMIEHGYGDDMTPAEWREATGGNGSMFVPAIALQSPRWRLLRDRAVMAIAMHEAMKGEP